MLICETRDDKGNAIVYKYEEENSDGVDLSQAHEQNRTASSRSANRYLKRIKYGNRVSRLVQPDLSQADWMFEVVFDYGEHDPNNPKPNEANKWLCRHDPFSSYRAGFEVRTYRLCQRVLMFHHFPAEAGVGQDCLVRSTDFVYRDLRNNPDDFKQGHPIASFIAAVTQSGYKRTGAGGYLKKSLPPLEFEYSQAIIQEDLREIEAESLENLPVGLDGAVHQWVDLDGEGISGLLTEQGGTWFYKRNLSPNHQVADNGHEHTAARFGPVEIVATKPALGLAGGQAQFLDLAGDGQIDLVQMDGPVRGFYERTDDADWAPFHAFSSWPNLDTRDPNLKFVDLTGDGHADILLTEDEALTWHPSLAKEGFGPSIKVRQSHDEEKGPKLIFADGTQSIYLADLSGDGLTDLVRIRNGEVCYWPNLGYGRFGAKVTMDASPWFDSPDLFDQRRIRLADIDGSGVTDIIYLGSDAIHLYFNQSGNSWSERRTLNYFPRTNNLSSVQAVDLLGNGTACLVWSSPLPGDARRAMRYIDLMGGQKPHLLLKTINNLGAETHVHYAPSTKFYLQDEQAGQPWITKLPFPVHVVERVETFDQISRNWFVTRYAYHHGYFDGEEREFRGFGMVEQFDTEEFAALNAAGILSDATNIAAASHVPPIHTKAWFHTGAYQQGARLSQQFAHEYYGRPAESEGDFKAKLKKFEATLLDDTVLPAALSAEEERQACRALKGSILRQEVYALDGTPEQPHPYSVSERNYTIERMQERENQHAVFFAHPRETLDYHYERNPADPRLSHSLVLHVDAFGNVLKAVAIGYGRGVGMSTLLGDDKTRQEQLLITYTENDYTENDMTNPADWVEAHRAPLPCEARTYELTGFAPATGARRFAFDDFAKDGFTALTSLNQIPYETPVAPAVKGKRLIECVRTRYRRNDLTALLPKGALQSLALPGESYKLAFTPGLLNVYAAKIAAADLQTILREEGKYVELDNDGQWWIPSGRVFYSTNAAGAPAQELAEARAHFFLPRLYRDPFWHDTIVDYDGPAAPNLPRYDLLVTRTADALKNVVRAENNYCVLQAWRMTDPNGNQSEAAFDTLGLVVATAVIGKNGEGDKLEDFNTDLTQDELDAFFAAPRPPNRALLGKATTRIIYDVDRYARTGKPAYAAVLARETHASDAAGATSAIQVSLGYSDGFGREIQKKIQAEKGPLQPGGADVEPRWVGSGWTIFNNKGKPVRQYEPFFSATHDFEFGKKVGVSPTLFYDPAERIIATLHPNHTYEKVVFDPWQQTSFDVNDTLKFDPKTDDDVSGFFTRLPDADYLPTWFACMSSSANPPDNHAAQRTEAHADTPTKAHFDALGRPFLTIADNGTPGKYETRVELDLEGNQRAVIDAKNRLVMRYDYDMLGNRIKQASMEAGARWMLANVAGKPIRAWDDRHFTRRITYDALQRPTGLYVTEPAGERLAEQTIYGEDKPSPEATNHRGKVWQVRDDAGIVTSEVYDFKGNLLSGKRDLRTQYKTLVNWAQQPAPATAETFTSSSFDALNRMIEGVAPDGSVTRPRYNEANLLDAVEVRLPLPAAAPATPFVTNINYDAKGQRELIAYGNGAQTAYEYDPLTFRLTHLKTTRPANPDATASQLFKNVTLVQDLRYTYDPAGNITRIEDAALKTITHNGEPVEPVCEYTYDAIYRLIEAKGREHIGQTAHDFNPPEGNRRDYPFLGLRAHPNDAQAMRNYTERYEYDAVGNFEIMRHMASGGAWTRSYDYEEASLLEPAMRKSNRLTRTKVGNDTETYTYKDGLGNDVHGCMTAINSMKMRWDFEDQLTQVDLQGGGTAYYVYDAAGQRVRKVIERNGATVEERIYLGGYEVYRKRQGGALQLERLTLHVMDDKQRIALVETKTQESGLLNSLSKFFRGPEPLIRYQFGNHLGSASLELDHQAQIISYEEYTPYGSTSYQAVRSQTETPKRYRYTGKERDEESGFSYHGARYYAPWLGKWVSCDPASLKSGINLFVFVRCNPLGFVDPTGNEPQRSKNGKLHTAQKTTEYIFGDTKPDASKASDSSGPYKFSYSTSGEAEDTAKAAADDAAVHEMFLESHRLLAQALATRTVERSEAIKAGAVLGSVAIVGVYTVPRLLALVPPGGWLAMSILQLAQAKGENDPNFVLGVLGVAVGMGALAKSSSEATVASKAATAETLMAPPAAEGIGPAYRTFEEVEALIQAGKVREAAHVLGVIVKSPEGEIIGKWYEVSELGVGTEQAKLLGHTEQKALARLGQAKLQPGSTVEFVGNLQPCNLPQGCSATMTKFAQQTGVDIRYRHVFGEHGTTIHEFRASEGRITQGMRKEMKQ